ncbi:hypothetical protein BOX15_Mlig004304g3, partial [Macrostomum lignano]
ATAASPTGDTAAAAVPNSSPSSVRQRRSPQHRSSQQRPASAVVSATSRHGEPDDEAWLARLLAEVDLTAFHRRIREDLQVTKLRHFDFVKSDDLERLGLSRPSARRLLDAVKRWRHAAKKKKQQQQQGLIDRLRLSSKALPSQPAAAAPAAAVEAPANLELLLPSAAAVSASAPAGGAAGGAAGLAPMAPALSSGEQLMCLISSKSVYTYSKLGSGQFADVMKGDWVTPSGAKLPVAVKILRDPKSGANTALEDFVKEVNSMHSLSHPNLIRLYGACLSSPLMIVTELAPLGCLLNRLRDEGSAGFSLIELCNYADQVVSGMAYLESRRCVHRDLACRNLLLASRALVKIGDFGLMRLLPANHECYTMGKQSTVPFAWCAPESLRHLRFSHASDVFMLGVTLWEFFTYGEHPWVGYTGAQILEKVTNGERLSKPNCCPGQIYRLMLACWQLDPKSRPTFAALKAALAEAKPIEVLATRRFDEADRLGCEEGDKILVLDGRPENFWWHGQNQRTSEVGWFPRALASTGKPLDPRDISRPIKNSFIHTGHGGMNQDTWGQPGHIDDVYLRNPMDPEDLSRPGCSVQQSEFLPPTGLGPADAASSSRLAAASPATIDWWKMTTNQSANRRQHRKAAAASPWRARRSNAVRFRHRRLPAPTVTRVGLHQPRQPPFRRLRKP